MMKLVWFLLSLELLSQIITVDGSLNETCTTTMLQLGRCVLVKDCPFVLRMLRSDLKTDEEWYYLHHNKCEGTFDTKPLICCPLVSNEEICGAAVGKRIFGGDETSLGEIPWAGVLWYRISRISLRFAAKCGCTLLNSRWVVTAAHCIANVPVSWKIHRVRFSEWNTLKKANCTLTEDGVEICRQEYEVEFQKIHPDYDVNALDMRHDIALLKTKTTVDFNKYVVPICLPFSLSIRSLPIENEIFTVTGWGQTEKGKKAGIQYHVEIPGRNNDVCDKAFKPVGINLTEDQLCVGGDQGKDSCRGDSGGALTREVGVTTYLVGIVSLGANDCGTKNHPGVYTNVANYLHWIEEVLSSNEEHES